MFGARTIIIWEDQLVDPAIHYLTSVNALLLAFKVARRYGSSMPMILHDFLPITEILCLKKNYEIFETEL